MLLPCPAASRFISLEAHLNDCALAIIFENYSPSLLIYKVSLTRARDLPENAYMEDGMSRGIEVRQHQFFLSDYHQRILKNLSRNI